ncbi:unnamed protein product, partial [Ixodes persulcatus]
MAKRVAAREKAPQRDDLAFFTDGRLTDVEFLVENGEDPPQWFKAHKMMLAIRNEVFEAMFYGNLPEKDKVHITDLHPDGFCTFLKYLYSRKAAFVDIQQALHARTAAQKYLESKLVEACDAFIRKSLKPADVCVLLEYGKKFGSTSNFDDLIDRLVSEHTAELLESKAFIAASKETVIRVLNSTKVNIKEYDVIKSVYAWAVAHCKQETDDPLTAALQETMRPFLPQLRFLTLTPKEFVQCPFLGQVMTDSETLAVLSNLILPGSKALPEDICTSTENRHIPAHG